MKTEHLERYTWDAWLAHVGQPATVSPQSRQSEWPDRDGFSQTATYAEALDLARKGWPEGLEQIRAQFTAIKAVLNVGDEMNSRLSDSGDDVEVGLFLDGDPEHWIEYPLMPKAHPVVKLIVSISASCGVSAETIFRKGAAIVAVVDGLEASGVRCEIEADHTVNASPSGKGNTYTNRIMVKRAEDSLDLDRIAFALCHPSMLRRLCFRTHELGTDAEWERRGGKSYGYPEDPTPEPGAYVVPCASWSTPEWRTLEGAAAKAKAIIAELESAVV